MKHDDFVKCCLEGVPEGAYRDRAEKELKDHLLTSSRDLEAAGYPPEEAQGLALSRMGDPAELSRRYVREWQRSLGRSCLIAAEQLLAGTVMVVMACLYAVNTSNFGKSIVGYWSFVAIPAVGLLLCSLAARCWPLACWINWVILVIQLPPIFCWLVFLGEAFEMSGVMVPGRVGFSIHLLFFLWGLANCRWLNGLRLEERKYAA